MNFPVLLPQIPPKQVAYGILVFDLLLVSFLVVCAWNQNAEPLIIGGAVFVGYLVVKLWSAMFFIGQWDSQNENTYTPIPPMPEAVLTGKARLVLAIQTETLMGEQSFWGIPEEYPLCEDTEAVVKIWFEALKDDYRRMRNG